MCKKSVVERCPHSEPATHRKVQTRSSVTAQLSSPAEKELMQLHLGTLSPTYECISLS